MSEQNTKFHISLHVADITKSVEFYGRLFGAAPTKLFSDYAKFEIEEPGLVLSLEKRQSANSPYLNHAGLRVASRNELIEWTSKVSERGLDFQHLDHVSCCYADQSKIFFNDPDGLLFEIYNVNQDLIPENTATTSAIPTALNCATAAYDHMLPSEFPQTLPSKDGTLEIIALRGSLNAKLDDSEYFRILAECRRALKPGGELILHMLVSDSEASEEIPKLPEPAAYVRRVPSEAKIWDCVREAGFVGLNAERFGSHHVFAFKNSKFRELLLKAYQPNVTPTNQAYLCTYKGPFPKVELENGVALERGKRTVIDPETFALVTAASCKDAFVFLNEDVSACADQ